MQPREQELRIAKTDWEKAHNRWKEEQQKLCASFDQWKEQQFTVMQAEFTELTAKLAYEIQLRAALSELPYPFDHKPGTIEAKIEQIHSGEPNTPNEQ